MTDMPFLPNDGADINLTGVTTETNANLFIEINGAYIGSLWVHDGEVTWGASDEWGSDWFEQTTVRIPKAALDQEDES